MEEFQEKRSWEQNANEKDTFNSIILPEEVAQKIIHFGGKQFFDSAEFYSKKACEKKPQSNVIPPPIFQRNLPI